MTKNNSSRLTIIETSAGIQLIISVYKFWIGIVFLFIWVAGTIVMSFVGLGIALFGFFNSIIAGMFGLFWTALVSGIGFLGIAELLWMLKGKEVITVANGTLTIKKERHLLYRQAKTYLLNSITDLKVERVPIRRMFVWKIELEAEDEMNLKQDYFCFSFIYQGKSIYFGEYLPKAEATAALQKILDKTVLT